MRLSAYKAYDDSKEWYYHEDLLEKVKARGFNSISEMFHKTYIKEKSLPKTATEIGVSLSTVRRTMRALKVEIRKPGGYHGGSKNVLNAEVVKDLRIEWYDIASKEEGAVAIVFMREFFRKRRIHISDSAARNALNGCTWFLA